MWEGIFLNFLYFSNCLSKSNPFFPLFFLPFFSIVWLIDLSPPPFIILHQYLFLFYTTILKFSHPPNASFTFPMPTRFFRFSLFSLSLSLSLSLFYYFFIFLWTLFSLSSSQISSQNSSSASFLVSLTETIMVVFFVKKSCKALCRHHVVTAPFFFFFFFFFFFWSKKSRRSIHCWKEFFSWNWSKRWCEFNVWQNLMVEVSTMVICCCESIMFLVF